MANEETKEERQFLPEVKAYTDATEAAQGVFDKAIEEARAKYPKRNNWDDEGRKEHQAFNSAEGQAYDVRSAAFTAAWDALKGSGDPLVKWIAENCEGYSSEALIILQALPATPDELDEIAERQDWCSTWNSFREEAIAAGVMPGIEAPSEAYKAVFAKIDDVACCRLDARARRAVGKALDALLAEARAEEAVAA